MAVTVRPIADCDVEAVGRFLHAELNPRVSARQWAEATDVPWQVDAPNRGFLLHDDSPARAADDGLVGVYLAFYSVREIDGRAERFCNLGAWCVLPAYRIHSLRLLKALLAQPGYHFTDLSPSGNVIGLNARLGFELLDTASALLPALPFPTWPGRVRVSADPATIAAALQGRDLDLYRDHAATAASHHVLLRRGEATCWVMFRKDRRKNIPVFASVLHVSNPEVFTPAARAFARHVLVRHGVLAILAESRAVGEQPLWSIRLARSRPKMFHSSTLRPHHIDNLYSELACVAW
jgi:hypothetical protein